MLDKLQRLKESITFKQAKILRDTLGEELSDVFFDALDSEEEDEAIDGIKEFGAALRKKPFKALKLSMELTKSQKELIEELKVD